MKEEIITIKGLQYHLVLRDRPVNLQTIMLYQGHDSFVRIGDPKIIDLNLQSHKKLELAGFPVPKILDIGAVGDEKYFIEKSLGDKILRLQFAEEQKNNGLISQKTFNGFLKIIEYYLTAQVKTITKAKITKFIELANVNKLCKELPDFAKIIQNKTQRHLKELSEFPFVLSHGDLSPNNLFATGIIDFENSWSAPFGYDAVSALVTNDWFPADVEFEFEVTFWDFTKEQKNNYLALCDNISAQVGFPKISSKLKSFAFFRAAWLAEGMGEWPKTQKYRHERFIKDYLRN